MWASVVAEQGLISCGSWALEHAGFVVVAFRLLIAVASLVAEHGLQGEWASLVVAHRLSSRGIWAQLLCRMWNLPGPGIKHVSPALADIFLSNTTSHLDVLFGEIRLKRLKSDQAAL